MRMDRARRLVLHAPRHRAEVAAACEGKRFLDFDDAAYGPALQAFLADRYPEKCKYER